MCLSGSLVKFVWIFTSLTSSDKVLSFIFLPRYFRTVTFQWVICTMYMLGLTEDLQFSFQSVLISHPFSRRRLESIETSQPLFLANFEWFLSGDCLGLLGILFDKIWSRITRYNSRNSKVRTQNPFLIFFRTY